MQPSLKLPMYKPEPKRVKLTDEGTQHCSQYNIEFYESRSACQIKEIKQNSAAIIANSD